MPVFPARLSLTDVAVTTEGEEIINTQGPFMSWGYFITGVCTGLVSVQLQIKLAKGMPWEPYGVPQTALDKAFVTLQIPFPMYSARLVQTGTMTGTAPKLSGYILFMAGN